MTTFPKSPAAHKGGIVLLNGTTSVIERIIALQYNPASLSRSLKPQGVSESSDHTQVLRLKGPPVETYTLDAEIDATDQLEFPDQNKEVTEFGIAPMLSTLESMAYPKSRDLLAANALADSGSLEIFPTEGPLILFIWGKTRVIPVKITNFSITEEAFDQKLNPIMAKVNLGMQVLSVADFGFNTRGGSLYMAYHQQKEQLAAKFKPGLLSTLGLNALP